ncbi:ATP-binding protein [Pedobacter caeni]|uniref:IstB-like ATP binding protein n=1 Tax=Pedobacter caeni TaxID=288992 RepID=A0A1M5ERQ2_9SPHI|nr:ATP-binding protein [Pedobacter caeni]SHF81814.1 IstB-like ATP binding protein [Pedobacter caeni]
MRFITRKDVLLQLKRDLIGKDAYRGVTLTYSWMANQFGHFSLGFIPTFILYTILSSKTEMKHVEIWSPLIIWGFWILFEACNFLGPLLLNTSIKKSASGKKTYIFDPEWSNVTFDTLTDLCFFGIGALGCSLICVYSPAIMIGFIILCLLSLYPSYYWYSTKMHLQNAGYPFQLRLSQWNFKMQDQHKKMIKDFLRSEEKGKHLLLFGSKGSGKTSLSVGIATELSIRNNRCSYVTATKLLSMFFEQSDSSSLSPGSWTWHDSSLLVIDDINPGGLIKKDILRATLFYELLNNPQYGPFNIQHIKAMNIIWVMGNEEPTEQVEERWETLLGTIGVPQSDIITVNLGGV